MRAVLDLANHTGVRRKAREIAEEMGIPSRYLTQILANLVQHGLLTAVAGPAGGYCLSRPAKDISLLDVVEAAEGPISLDRCVIKGGPCTWEDTCPIHVPWARAQKAMASQLSSTSFGDLAESDQQLVDGTYELPADTPPHKIHTKRKPKTQTRIRPKRADSSSERARRNKSS